MNQNSSYGLKLSVIYGAIWFVDLLDSTILNVALPEISRYFHIDPTDAEWALIGFLLSMTIGMIISHVAGNFLGVRKLFIGAQWLYLISSLACGLSANFAQLVIFRIFQGFGGGLAIPIGMSMIITTLPQEKWVKNASWINLFTLIAPALGPVLAGYITQHYSWRWLFFIKLPISLIAVLLSHLWIHKIPHKREKTFDWLGFYFVAFGLSLLLLVLSEVGKPLFSNKMLIFLFIGSLVLLGAFIWHQYRAPHPIMPIRLFHYPLFGWGNLVQSAANTIFLGATFIVALYLQWGLGFSIVKTGWVMAAITVGMITAMPFTGKFYNRAGPLPFIIPGLIFMGFAMLALLFVNPHTSPWWIAFLIFLEGLGSAGLQTTNFASIFSEVPVALKGPASSLYALLKQISASFGVALSTMMLSISMKAYGITALSKGAPLTLFRGSFILLGLIPLLALLCCFFIDNKKALQKISSHKA